MRSRHTDGVLLTGLGLIAVQLVFRGWFAFTNWFQFDDLVFLTRVNGAPLSSDLLLEGYGGHFMPSGFLLTWLFGHNGSLDYTPYAVTLLVLQALASLGFLVLLRSLFGSRWAVLVPLSLYLFLALSFPAYIWWAAGINQLALQIALGWGLWAHLQHLRTRRIRWALTTAAILVLCLTFYEKVLLVYGAIAVLTLAYFATGSLLQRVLHVWRTYRTALVLHVASGIAFLAVYVHFAYNFGESASKAPGLALIWNLLGKALLPGVVGGPLRWDVLTGAFQLADPAGLVVVASWCVLIAMVLHIHTVRLRSLRAWSLVAWFVVCGVVLLGSARASVLGPTSGLEFRYLTEFALVVPLALALAVLPIIGADESTTPRPGAARPLLTRPSAVIASVATVCVLGVVSTWQYGTHWVEADAPRDYFHNVESSLGSPEEPTPLVNVSVPEFIMWGYEYPLNTTKYVLRSYRHRMVFPQATQDQLFVVSASGTVRPVALTPMHKSQATLSECGFTARPGRTARVPLDSVVDTTDLWTRMSYSTKEPTSVTVSAGDSSYEIELDEGLHNMYFHVQGTFSGVRVSVPSSGSRVCLYEAEVGQPVAAEPAPETEEGQ